MSKNRWRPSGPCRPSGPFSRDPMDKTDGMDQMDPHGRGGVLETRTLLRNRPVSEGGRSPCGGLEVGLRGSNASLEGSYSTLQGVDFHPHRGLRSSLQGTNPSLGGSQMTLEGVVFHPCKGRYRSLQGSFVFQIRRGFLRLSRPHRPQDAASALPQEVEGCTSDAEAGS